MASAGYSIWLLPFEPPPSFFCPNHPKPGRNPPKWPGKLECTYWLIWGGHSFWHKCSDCFSQPSEMDSLGDAGDHPPPRHSAPLGSKSWIHPRPGGGAKNFRAGHRGNPYVHILGDFLHFVLTNCVCPYIAKRQRGMRTWGSHRLNKGEKLTKLRRCGEQHLSRFAPHRLRSLTYTFLLKNPKIMGGTIKQVQLSCFWAKSGGRGEMG